MQGQLQSVLPPEAHAVLGEFGGMVTAAVVETWLALGHEPHPTADHAHESDQSVPISRVTVDHRHEIQDLAHTIPGSETG